MPEKNEYRFYGWQEATVRDPHGLTPRDLYDLLTDIWCADTCAPRMRGDWTPENRTLGQCSVTAFLAQDLFGGRVYGVPLEDGSFHCFNVAGDCVFDLTSEQFGGRALCYKDCPEQFREQHFAGAEKRERYELLRARLLAALPDVLYTRRLILRPWRELDAADCYLYASDPLVGPAAGWPPHKSEEESRRIIREVLSIPGTYAILLKETGRPVGCISLKQGVHTDLTDQEDECELGYWLGSPHWGRGLMPEAVEVMLYHAFRDLGMAKVWCGYYDGNLKSKRVQEKCGFHYMRTTDQVEVPLLGEIRRGHVNCLTREEWQAARDTE